MVKRKDAPRSGPARSIAVTLRPDWHYDPKRRAFVSSSDERVSLVGVLPKGARVTHVDPAAARAAAAGTILLGSPEHDLARYVLVTLPTGARPRSAVPALAKLVCVTKASAAAEISAPCVPGP